MEVRADAIEGDGVNAGNEVRSAHIVIDASLAVVIQLFVPFFPHSAVAPHLPATA